MKKNKSRIFVSGKFKVIHTGHLRLLRLAKEMAQELVVGVDVSNLDEEEIKWRLSAIGSIEIVDQVVAYTGDIELILQRIKPSIILKGKEFENQFNPELNYVIKHGANLVFSSGDSFFSEYDLLGSPVASSKFAEFDFNSARELSKHYEILIQELVKNLRALNNIEVLVVGDLIVDEIVNCHPLGISSEETAVVATPIDTKRFIGGAGIVAAHCAALGTKVTLLSCRGDDEVGEWAENMLKDYAVETILGIDNSRPTTLKQRFRSGNQTLFRLTHLRQDNLSEKLSIELLNCFKQKKSIPDVIIFSDFSYGVCNPKIIDEILSMGKNHKSFLAADSQSSSQIGNLSKFKGVNLITATEKEVRNETRDQTGGITFTSLELQKSLNCPILIVKVGADGILMHVSKSESLLESEQYTEKLPAFNAHAKDVSGAGDSLLAITALTMSIGASPLESAFLGSITAAIQVSRIGNVPITTNDVEKILDEI